MVQCVSETTSSCSQNKDRPCPVSYCLEHSTKKNKLTRSLSNYKQHAVLAAVVIAVDVVLVAVVVAVVVVLSVVAVALVVLLSAVVVTVAVVVAVVAILAAVVVTVVVIAGLSIYILL